MYRLKTSNNKYVAENSELTTDINKALTFKQKEKIDNFIKNMPRKFNGIDFEIEEINNINEEKTQYKKAPVKKPLEVLELKTNIEATLATINKLKKNKNEYKRLLSEVDKNISAVYHYIELTDNISKDKCAEIISILKTFLIKRREYKFILQVIQNIENKNLDGLKELVKVINLLGNNLYLTDK